MGIWECHDLSKLNEFLGITIRCSGHKIILDQKVYLTKVLDHFSMTNAITVNMPLLHSYTPAILTLHFGYSTKPERKEKSIHGHMEMS